VFRCTIPEGVEVKISAELVKPIVQNRKIISIETYPTSRYADFDPEGYKEFQNTISELHDVYVESILTKGKFMYWKFNNDWYMFSTFGMSGQWSPLIGKHPCFSLGHASPSKIDKAKIYFNDPRHFGTVKFTNNRQDLLDKLNELGWDPLQDDLEIYLPFIKSQFSKTSKPVGQMLMDQTIFAGVGNYIRAEALYLAKMSPWRKCNSLTTSELEILCNSIIQVMQESYQHQGATIHTYKDAYGNEGKYSSCFKVYGQKEDPLGNKILKEETPDKRSIHWCPAIQL